MDERVARQAAEAGGDALWRALQPLRSTATWLMFGAHPDDEWNGFLAWLVLGHGIRAVYACATRGDGGQNALGPERGADIAAIRSREMECAAQEIGFGLRWMTPGGDDSVRDFGFSKSGVDTLARWGHEVLIERMARAIRDVRPDAISPTFLDVPGQHGHHRAVTGSLVKAMDLAADATWSCGLPPWRVRNAYLPAFSGGGGTYDDELPPPPATVTVDLGACSDVLGASWAQIGEWSRRFHASQGMGRWIPDGERPLPLHKSHGPPDRAAPLDAAPHNLAALARSPWAVPAAAEIVVGAHAIETALAAWPDRAAVADALHLAVGALAAAIRALSLLQDDPGSDVIGRLARKQREAALAASLALGMSPRLVVTPNPLRPRSTVTIEVANAARAAVAVRTPPDWRKSSGKFTVPSDAAPLGTLRDRWEPLGGSDIVGATLTWTHQGTAASLEIDPPEPVCIAPATDVSVTPSRVVRRMTDPRPAALAVFGAEPPKSWNATKTGGNSWRVAVPPGRTDPEPLGARLETIGYPHIGRAARVVPAAVSLVGIDTAIDPSARVGVVAGETDTTLGWLKQLGVDAVAIDDATIDDATIATGAFDHFTTIVVGMFAYRQRPALASARQALLQWIEAGGRLVTFYHRPIDAWDADATPPRRLRIGTPSLRWRVSDPAAAVRVLAPESRLLSTPNRITDADWSGWVRERGLYFASEWDSAYRPVLELGDPGEPPLQGALLEAEIGRGGHVHVALALHYQWEALVPGAFRLLANLVAGPPPAGGL